MRVPPLALSGPYPIVLLVALLWAPGQLRHTLASAMLSRNAPLLYVQQQDGWRRAAVLLRVYARWIPLDFESVLAQQATATQAQPARRVAELISTIQRPLGHSAAGLNFQK